MQVWDAHSDAMITFNEDNLDQEIAYIVENNLLLHAIDKELENKPSVQVIYNAKVDHVSLPDNYGENAKIKLQNGQEFQTKLLVRILFINFYNI